MLTSALTTQACKEAYTSIPAKNNLLLLLAFNIPQLKYAPCIYYRLCFKNDQTKIQALLDSGSEVNAMASAYATSLDLKIRPMNIEA